MNMRTKICILNISGLLILGILSVMITIRASQSYSRDEIANIRSLMWEERKTQLNDLIANAYTVMKTANFWVDAQRTIHAMRFGEAQRNYFFIVDTDGMMYVHPHQPELIGKIQFDLKDADGEPIIRKIVEIAKEKGEGFIEYRWPKPGSDRPVKKLTCFKLYKEWKWIVCTGAYMDDIEKVISQKEAQFTAKMREHIRSQVMLMAAVLVGVMVFSTLISRRMSLPITRSIKMLNDISVKVTTASTEVFISSRDLAQNASEQTKVIHEALHSLEEIVAHTRNNVGNAKEIRVLMSETQEVLNQTGQSLEDLDESMKSVCVAGEQIRVVAETIDSLAFKTRIVALNAAIEAARLGETGSGFAVIADEIRRLSDHSAKAAKHTAQSIEASVHQLNAGMKQVMESKIAFDRALARVHEAAEIIGNINASSEHQYLGIERIRQAAAVMNKVAGHNTNNARESALAANTMKVQADQMNLIVSELVKLIKGEFRNGHKRNGNKP